MWSQKQPTIDNGPVTWCSKRWKTRVFGRARSFGPGVCGRTVNAQLDLPAGVAHGAGGGAHVEAGVLGRGPREVEVSVRIGLQEGAVSG